MSETGESGPEYYKNYVIARGLIEGKAYYFWFNDGTGFYGTPEEFGHYAERRLSARPDDYYEFDHNTDEEGNVLGFPLGPEHAPIEIGLPTHEGETPFDHRGKKDPRF